MNDTTPRDDIAGLRAWGNADLSFVDGEETIAQLQLTCREAATQLDAQAAELASLCADNDKMHDLVDQLTQAHHDAEAKCDDLAQRLKDLRVVANYNREQAEATEARATRAEQERDEAYERAAEEVDALALHAQRTFDAFSHGRPGPCITAEAYKFAAKSIRQLKLASGPDKEKRE